MFALLKLSPTGAREGVTKNTKTSKGILALLKLMSYFKNHQKLFLWNSSDRNDV